MSIYDFEIKKASGLTTNLSQYRGKVLLIFNSASKCGYAPQLTDLQRLQEMYGEKGLQVLAFPSNQFEGQEPLNDDEIVEFCAFHHGVNFPIFKKINVRGENAHPLFTYLSDQIPFKGFDMNHTVSKLLATLLSERYPDYLVGNSIKWNFTKFLIDRDGNVVERFEPPIGPFNMKIAIEKLL